METLVIAELVGADAGASKEDMALQDKAVGQCVYRKPGSLPKRALCERLGALCGNSVSVGESICRACRVHKTFEPETNPELANCVCHVAWARFFPEAPREICAPEAEGERDCLIASVKRCRGIETAKKLVDTMFAAGIAGTAEEALKLCLDHGLVEP